MMNPVNTRTKNASRILAHHRRLVDAGGSSMPFRRVAAGELMMAILCDRRMRSRPTARLRPVVVAVGISGGAVVDGRAGRRRVAQEARSDAVKNNARGPALA